MPSDNALLNKPVPHAKLIIGSLVGALLLAFSFLAGTQVSSQQNLSEQLETELINKDSMTKEQVVTAPNQTRQLPGLLRSNLMNLDVTWINPQQPIVGPGGGISHHNDSILLAKHASGAVHRFNQVTGEFYQLKIFLPLTNQASLPTKTEDGRNISPLRYNSLSVYEQSDTQYMLSFYGYYNKEKNCRTVRVSKAALPLDWLDRPQGSVGIELEWELIFEAAPCLTFTGTGEHVTGYQEGGAMLRDQDNLYFTTGDMGHDGIGKRKPVLTQSQTSDYGRLFRLNLTTSQVTRVASGLRNTPSLAMDSENRLWSVDIGPQGGDELNLLDTDKNYGWPYATYGVDYTGTDTDFRRWPYGEVLGQHDDRYEKPKYFWPAAITPGGVTYVNDFHPAWDGNLMVAALTGYALVRLSMQGDRVLGAESLPMPFRLKSVINAHQRIYFLTDFGWLGYLTPRKTQTKLTPRQIANNQLLQNAGCTECHSNPMVPSLAGLAGRDIASLPNVNYSKALREKGGEWTKEELKKFLTHPQKFAPGTLMPNPQLSSGQIDDIIGALVSP